MKTQTKNAEIQTHTCVEIGFSNMLSMALLCSFCCDMRFFCIDNCVMLCGGNQPENDIQSLFHEYIHIHIWMHRTMNKKKKNLFFMSCWSLTFVAQIFHSTMCRYVAFCFSIKWYEMIDGERLWTTPYYKLMNIYILYVYRK